VYPRQFVKLIHLKHTRVFYHLRNHCCWHGQLICVCTQPHAPSLVSQDFYGNDTYIHTRTKATNRVTRLGKWVIFLLWTVSLKITEVAHFTGLLFPQLRLCINFDPKGLGLHFGRFHPVTLATNRTVSHFRRRRGKFVTSISISRRLSIFLI
jgi:hypothetical protein